MLWYFGTLWIHIACFFLARKGYRSTAHDFCTVDLSPLILSGNQQELEGFATAMWYTMPPLFLYRSLKGKLELLLLF